METVRRTRCVSILLIAAKFWQQSVVAIVGLQTVATSFPIPCLDSAKDAVSGERCPAMTISVGFGIDDVFNQSPPYQDVDLFASDAALMGAVAANGAASEAAQLSAFGRHWGTAAMIEAGRLANENPPKLKAFDAKGYRRDVVEFHPAYHRLMGESITAGLAAMTWRADGTRAAAPAEVARAARYYMVAQIENGHMCPVTMTRAAVATVAAEPGLAASVLPKILARRYDPALRPWSDKAGMTLGMGMTERQGGTDVRANTSLAAPVADGYVVNGHKWFLSAPMGDAFLVLAQLREGAEEGLTCFLMPRFRPDGTLNGMRLQRLKDKLGNRSNASSEVEFVDAFAWRIGEPGRGVRTIIDMVQLTRLDCAIASAGLMRGALVQALHHARRRSVFGRRLADQPLMRTVLAALAADVEGAVAAVMRLCRSFDLMASDPREAARARLLTPVIKYWICKTAPAFVYEAMECLGGNGYVEDSILARYYREAPVNAIWEGSGNVVCLDVLRALARERDAAAGVFEQLKWETVGLPGAAEAVGEIEALLTNKDLEADARALVERLAHLAAAAACRECAPARVAEAFATARLVVSSAGTYGARPLGDADAAMLLDRALPA
jgi:putative acyl-CoA dehydrogenase